MIDKDSIKLSTKLTFRKSNVDIILDELNDSQKDKLLRELLDRHISENEYYEQLAREMDELEYLGLVG